MEEKTWIKLGIIAAIMAVLGKEETIRRINRAIERHQQ